MLRVRKIFKTVISFLLLDYHEYFFLEGKLAITNFKLKRSLPFCVLFLYGIHLFVGIPIVNYFKTYFVNYKINLRYLSSCVMYYIYK